MRATRRLRWIALGAAALGPAMAAGQGVDERAGHGGSGPMELPAPVAGATAEQQWQFLDQYCSKCHNVEDWAGGIAFEALSPQDIPEDAETWEKTVRKLRGRLMPPAGNPQPDAASLRGFVSWMEGNIDRAALAHPDPGHSALHRLNRKEYANAVRDLLAVEVDPAEILPRDDARDGFDNVASALQVSPSFLDQYLAAARTVAVKALGNPAARPVGAIYSAGGDGPQFFRTPGLPLGTRGGLEVEHDFPADGEYVVNVANMAQAIWVYNMEFENQLIVTLDRKRIYETTIGGEEDMKSIDQKQDPAVDAINKRLKNIRFTTTAGPHRVGVTFVHRSYSESEDRLARHAPGGGQDRVLSVSSFEIRGPVRTAGVSETPSRKRIFECYPQNEAEEAPCARRILTHLGERAYRRPVTDADVQDLMRFYEEGRRADADSGRAFESGMRRGLTALLADPDFLYRAERPPQNVPPGSTYRLGDLELASRLSFFLWSSLPDEQLLGVARSGRLREPAVLAAEVRRMLADPRSETLASNFAFQWLNLAKLDEIQPDAALFPDLNGDVRDDFVEEMQLFVDSVFRENRSVLELLTADYTYLNERLALHYGIRDVRGSAFRRVSLEDPVRKGLLGKGAILMVSSYPNRTAPVLRGAFVLDRILGTPPAAPPPDVEALAENQEGKKALTVRELMAAHSVNPTCHACHGIMDPLGFALENFDAVGRYRERDRFAGTLIDASGELPDGTALKGPNDLRNALLREPDQFVQTLTEKLMTYGLGRTIEYTDMPTVRAIVRAAAADGYRFQSLVTALVSSDAFQMKKVVAPEPAPGTTVKQAAVLR